MGIERTSDDGHGWWDQSTRKVYGRRRLRPKEHNEETLERVYNP